MNNPYFLKSSPEKTCPRCLFTDDIAEIGEMQCEYCNLHDLLEANAPDIQKEISKLHKVKSTYNCLIGISGGLDSSTLLYLAVKAWGLKPLVLHFNNGYNSDQAELNMKNLCEKLGVERIVFYPNKPVYDEVNDALLASGTPDLDILNDLYMTALMYQTADRYKIKCIVNGHCYRTEGSTPRLFTYMDSRYLDDIYKSYTGRPLVGIPKLTFLDQILYGFKGIYQIRPFHDKTVYDNRKYYESQMKSFVGWSDYGSKHCENLYTEIVGSYILPKKFGINKNIVYLSAKVRSGSITREEALMEYNKPSDFVFTKIPHSMIGKIDSEIKPRSVYKKYNFKKYKFVIYILWVLKVVPQTFLKKYCN